MSDDLDRKDKGYTAVVDWENTQPVGLIDEETRTFNSAGAIVATAASIGFGLYGICHKNSKTRLAISLLGSGVSMILATGAVLANREVGEDRIEAQDTYYG